MFQNDLLKGQRILVTGGATGLGRAMTERFLSLGADAVICGRRGDLAKSVAQEMADKYQRKVEAYPLDIRQAPAVDGRPQSKALGFFSTSARRRSSST